MTYLSQKFLGFAALSLAFGVPVSASAQDLVVFTKANTTDIIQTSGQMNLIQPTRTAISYSPVEAIEPRGYLSPAEIRNAIQLEVDRLRAAGIDIDPADLDGVGLDVSSEDELREEIQLVVERSVIYDPDWIGSRG